MNTKDLRRRVKFISIFIDSTETLQDIIVIFLCLGLLCEIIVKMWEMFHSLIKEGDFKEISQILFLLILVELFRLLTIYMQKYSISVDVAVEVSIVSVLREVIVNGVLQISCFKVLASCALLIVLGYLMLCTRAKNEKRV